MICKHVVYNTIHSFAPVQWFQVFYVTPIIQFRYTVKGLVGYFCDLN